MIKAIMVREDNGFYQIHRDAEPEPFGAYLTGGAIVIQAEPLTGWAPWTFAVQLDGGEFAGQWLFIDVAPGQDPASCPVCEGMGVMAPPCPPCDGTGGRPGPVPVCPVCQPVTVAP